MFSLRITKIPQIFFWYFESLYKKISVLLYKLCRQIGLSTRLIDVQTPQPHPPTELPPENMIVESPNKTSEKTESTEVQQQNQQQKPHEKKKKRKKNKKRFWSDFLFFTKNLRKSLSTNFEITKKTKKIGKKARKIKMKTLFMRLLLWNHVVPEQPQQHFLVL